MRSNHPYPSGPQLRRAGLAAAILLPSLISAAACSNSSSNTNNSTSQTGGSGGSGGGLGGSAGYGGNGGSAGGPTVGHTVKVQILAINDFHGNLMNPSPSNAVVYAKSDDPLVQSASPVSAGNNQVKIMAGGAPYLAAHIADLKSKNPNTIIASAGDLTGASAIVSNVFDDEPTINVMNMIGLAVNTVGNHEFDKGISGVVHFQDGGCDTTTQVDAGFHMLGSCAAEPTPFKGANFQYLGANIELGAQSDAGVDPTTPTLFPPYVIKNVGGAKIALLGIGLSTTKSIVSVPLDGITFQDEVATANAFVPVLKKLNVDAIGVLLHNGGTQDSNGTYNDCANLSADITAIAKGIDPAVSFIHTAHSHWAYNCTVNGRPVVQAASNGRLITQYDLTIDTSAHKVTHITAANIPVTRDITPDPAVKAKVDGYYTEIQPLAGQVEGYISKDLVKFTGPNGECPLGDVIAEGMLEQANLWANSNGITKANSLSHDPVDIAFMNIGGIRDSLMFTSWGPWPDGQLTYTETQAVMPFANRVRIIKCSAKNIVDIVQQNVFSGSSLKVLQLAGLNYTWSVGGDAGVGAADPTTFAVANYDGNGGFLDASDTTTMFNVATIDFLAGGKDGYTNFSKCTAIPFGSQPYAEVGVDLDVFNAYLQRTTSQSSPLAPPSATRIKKN